MLFTECYACRTKEFSTTILGSVLDGHVIKTLHVAEEDLCELHCYLDDRCQSINVISEIPNGPLICELNDKDHIQHPVSLIKMDGFKYRATVVSKPFGGECTETILGILKD